MIQSSHADLKSILFLVHLYGWYKLRQVHGDQVQILLFCIVSNNEYCARRCLTTLHVMSAQAWLSPPASSAKSAAAERGNALNQLFGINRDIAESQLNHKKDDSGGAEDGSGGADGSGGVGSSGGADGSRPPRPPLSPCPIHACDTPVNLVIHPTGICPQCTSRGESQSQLLKRKRCCMSAQALLSPPASSAESAAVERENAWNQVFGINREMDETQLNHEQDKQLRREGRSAPPAPHPVWFRNIVKEHVADAQRQNEGKYIWVTADNLDTDLDEFLGAQENQFYLHHFVGDVFGLASNFMQLHPVKFLRCYHNFVGAIVGLLQHRQAVEPRQFDEGQFRLTMQLVFAQAQSEQEGQYIWFTTENLDDDINEFVDAQENVVFLQRYEGDELGLVSHFMNLHHSVKFQRVYHDFVDATMRLLHRRQVEHIRACRYTALCEANRPIAPPLPPTCLLYTSPSPRD